MNDSWRDDLATEKQKEKLRFFGCTWDEGITKGQASDAIEQCVIMLPDKEREWCNRPATEEQIRELENRGEEIEEEMTYAEAKSLLSESEVFESPFQDACDEMEAQIEADRPQHILEWTLNDGQFDVYYRPATIEEVKAAMDFLNKTKPGWNDIDVVDAMETLSPDYRFNEAMRGILIFYCLPCRGRIDLKMEQCGKKIECPHCGYVNIFQAR